MLKLLQKPILAILITSMIVPVGIGRADELNLPDLGGQGAGLSAADEYRTGATVLRNLRNAGLVIDDPLLTDYLNNLGFRLLSQHEHGNTQFQFFLVNENSINAFALPGGFIGINYGLFSKTQSESELASVFAHEIAHVTQRHYARAYDMGSQSNLPILAALIAAMLLGGKGNDIASAAISATAASQIQKKINFTRHNEQEADRIGIQILSAAGFNANKMGDFFQKLEQESRHEGVYVPEFLRTHPVTPARISDAQSRARLLPKTENKDSLSYHLMRHRIIALANQNKQANVKQYEFDLKAKTGQELTATRYGYVLSLLRTEQYEKARKQINILIKNDPLRIAFLLAQADVENGAKNGKKAIEIYQNALKIYPNNESILHDYVETLIRQKEFKTGLATLEFFLKKPPRNPIFYQYLARCKAAVGNDMESHEAQAEYYYQTGQFHKAVEQINIALKTGEDNFYATTRLEAKLKHIREEIPVNQTEQ